MDLSFLDLKKELRERLRSRRAEAASQSRKAAFAVRDLFLAHFPLGANSCVAFTMAQGDELDPLPLAYALVEAGHCLCLPVVEQKDQPLVFRSYQWGDAFQRGPLRIPEPLPTAPLVLPDVLLVPLLGFDRAGHRLGQGGGFYDRTLAALRQQKKILVVGLAYAAQEENLIPTEPHDAPLDAILTEREIIKPER